MGSVSKTLAPNAPDFEVYVRAIKVHVRRLIAWGYQDARNLIKSDSEEPSITGFIRDAINNRLRTDCPRWCNIYYVIEEQPVQIPGVTGKRRPRTDIIIGMTSHRRPEYIFEAKRLSKNGFGVEKYVGIDGLGRFVEGKYASRYSEAAMLGYIQTDSLALWQNKLKAAIDAKADELCLKSAQHDKVIIDDFPLEWVSIHDRKTLGYPIDIYHILLDCCE
jgi:hypothetical protein